MTRAPEARAGVSTRAQLVLIAAVAAVMLVPAAIWLTRHDERLAGTNSILPRQPVATVEPGRRLCVRDLRPAAGTRAIRLRLSSPGTAEIRLTVRGGAGTRTGRALVAGPSQWVDVPVAELAREAPATVCAVPRGAPVVFDGTGELEADGRVQAFLAGRPLTTRVTVQYLVGGRPTLLSRLDDAARHASVFKADFVGPWTYWLLVLLVPLLWLAGLRRLVRGRGRLPAVWLVALLAFGNAAAWALVTPVFEGPDEYAHIAYAIHLGETGRTPVPASRAQFTSSEHLLALDATNAFGIHRGRLSRPPWSRADERAFERQDEQRRPARDDGGGGDITSVVHAPGYYALPAILYRVTRSLGGSFFDSMLAMRLASCLLAALTAACAFAVVRELAPRHGWAALAAGLLVGFQPMFSFLGGVVNTDMGVNFAAAALLLLLVRALRRGLTPAIAALIPLVFVWGVLAKATMLALAPVLLAGLAALAWRRAGDRRAWLIMAGSLAALLMAWLGISQALDREYLSLTETSAGRASIPQLLSYLWQQFLPHLPFMTDLYNGAHEVPAFSLYGIQVWGAFGWLSIVYPRIVYFGPAAVVAAVVVLAGRTALRERDALRSRRVELGLLGFAFVCVAVFSHLAFVRTSLDAGIAEQGRYFFPAIVVPAVFAAGACFGLGRRRAPLVATALVTAVMVFCGISQLYVFVNYYA